MEYKSFEVQMGQSPLLLPFAHWLVFAIPTVEIGIAFLLAFPATRMTGLYASFTLMNMFTLYIIVLMNYSYYIPCSCGGILTHMTWKTHLVFNIVFIAFSVIGILNLEKQRIQTLLLQ